MRVDEWTKTKYECFTRNLVCQGCPNETACRIGEKYTKKAYFNGMRPMKYIVLKTFANIGLKGTEKFRDDTRDE